MDSAVKIWYTCGNDERLTMNDPDGIIQDLTDEVLELQMELRQARSVIENMADELDDREAEIDGLILAYRALEAGEDV